MKTLTVKRLALSLGIATLLTFSGMSQAGTPPMGVYSGNFGEGKLTLFIDSAAYGKVTGNSLYKHNQRPITGTIRPQGNFWRIIVNEPATQIGDGKFDMTANISNPDVLIGNWQVFSKTDTKTGISSKNLTLKQTQCDYKKYEGAYPEASSRILDDEEMYTDPDTLDYMRNEIYARHGYSFSTAKWASTFGAEDWYVPCYTNVDSKLTSIEKENIINIKTMHAYMVANPNSWGR